MAALGLAALAKASAPYNIESFDEVLKPLWLGIHLYHGRDLVAFLKQCATTEGVTMQYIKQDILSDFFKCNYHQVVETAVELVQKSGILEIIGRIVNKLKDEAKPYQKMVIETITKVITILGTLDIDECLEVRLANGIICSFQEQTMEDQVMLDSFGTIINALSICVKPYLTQIVSTILWRLNNKSAEVCWTHEPPG
ncbi:hypothetical protein HD554DRAFT_2236314 [Boletus coccyginus]|nr:hypothetical protein HD554DRAFT_2236314 [Boletus coccyginus]